ncbi:MAG: BMP family lipoprotein [Oscillospiraceae bacterium]|jgi:basic membrane protein A
MRKILSLFLAVLLIGSLLAGCNKDTGDEKGGSEETVIKKVALVTDVGTIDDESFNQATWQGVKSWCEANGIDYTYYQPSEDSTDARAASIAQAVSEGANVIVMPGYLFGVNVMEQPPEYPDVYFIAVDVAAGDLTYDYETYYEPEKNATCMNFAEEQAGYLAGYATVKDGYTKLGFLGGMAVPAVVRYGFGFVQGCDAAAKELGVDIEINYTYGGQFYGDANITAKMDGWYSSGTEVVFACGGGIYTSAVEAALNHNGMVIGVDVDQHYVGENADYAYNPFLTSAMKGLQNVTETALDDLQKGNWDKYGGQFKNFSLNEGDYVGLPTEGESWAFKTFKVDEYQKVVDGIKDGSITISNSTDAMPAVSEFTTVNEIA